MIIVKEPFGLAKTTNSLSAIKKNCYSFKYLSPISKTNENKKSRLVRIAYNLYQEHFDIGIYEALSNKLIYDPLLKDETCKSRILIQIDQTEVYGSISDLQEKYNKFFFLISLGIFPLHEKINFDSNFIATDMVDNKIILKKDYKLKYNYYESILFFPLSILNPLLGNIKKDSKENMSEFLDLLDEELTKKYDPKSIPEKTADQ